LVATDRQKSCLEYQLKTAWLGGLRLILARSAYLIVVNRHQIIIAMSTMSTMSTTSPKSTARKCNIKIINRESR